MSREISPLEVLEEAGGASIGLILKAWLKKVGEGSPYDFYKFWKQIRPKTSYAWVRKVFYAAKSLSLIVPTRKVPSKGPAPKQLYALNPFEYENPAWFTPCYALWPSNRWGSKRYYKAKEKGLVRFGRAFPK